MLKDKIIDLQERQIAHTAGFSLFFLFISLLSCLTLYAVSSGFPMMGECWRLILPVIIIPSAIFYYITVRNSRKISQLINQDNSNEDSSLFQNPRCH